MLDDAAFEPLTGGCLCGHVRFRVERAPIVVNCCHCRFCQRLGGSAFAVNAMIEADRLTLTGAGTPAVVHVPSALPGGQMIHRCPKCSVTLWSNHSLLGGAIAIVRVGTLDEGDRLEPDVHCYTDTKHPWVVLPAGIPAFTQGYDPGAVWSGAARVRLETALRAGQV
jgi:hypothetical protein